MAAPFRCMGPRCFFHFVFFLVLWSTASGALAQSRESTEARVRLLAAPGSAVEVYRVAGQGSGVLDPKHLLPMGTIVSGRVYGFPAGNYYAVNGCSSEFFELQAGAQLDLRLRLLRLERVQAARLRIEDRLAEKQASSGLWDDFRSLEEEDAPAGFVTLSERRTDVQGLREMVPVECTHPLSSVRESWSDRYTFELLSGQVTMTIAGQVPTLLSNSKPQSEPQTEKAALGPAAPAAELAALSLLPVMVRAKITADSDYFVSAVSSERASNSKPVVAVPVGSVLWLPPGSYALELNGSRREIALQSAQGLALGLGSLEIRTPPRFPMDERTKAGGSPPFAYINEDVLFTLDTSYLVFPGSYTVSLEGGDVRAKVEIYAGEQTRMQTYGAKILWPRCEGDKLACKSPSAITLHTNQRPFALMNVEPGVPFLVLEGDYEYGVEGLRGVFRRLKTSAQGVAEETLARVRLTYRVKSAGPRVRTDLVRLESSGSELFGKSLDLLFHQPGELVAPPGNYELTYFVGDPAAERSKVRRTLSLAQGTTASLEVPLFNDKANAASAASGAPPVDPDSGLPAEKAEEETAGAEGSERPEEQRPAEPALPSRLKRLRR